MSEEVEVLYQGAHHIIEYGDRVDHLGKLQLWWNSCVVYVS